MSVASNGVVVQAMPDPADAVEPQAGLHPVIARQTQDAQSQRFRFVPQSPAGSNVMQYSADGRILLTGKGTQSVWTTADYRRVAFVNAGGGVTWPGGMLSPDGALTVAGAGDWNIEVWDVRANRMLHKKRIRKGPVTFSDDGVRLLNCAEVVSADGRLEISNARTGASIAGHPLARPCLALSPGGQYVVLKGDHVEIWGGTPPKPFKSLPQIKLTDKSRVAITKDARHVAVCDWNTQTVQVWDVETGGAGVQRPFEDCYGMDFSPTARWLGVQSEYHAEVLDTRTGAVVVNVDKAVARIGDIAFDPRGGSVAIGSDDLRIYTLPDGKEIIRRDSNLQPVGQLTVGSDGIIGTRSTSVVWDLSRLQRLDLAPDVLKQALSPDGQTVVRLVGKPRGRDNKTHPAALRVFDTATGRLRTTIPGDWRKLRQLEFLDNDHVAGTTRDPWAHKVHMWSISADGARSVVDRALSKDTKYVQFGRAAGRRFVVIYSRRAVGNKWYDLPEVFDIDSMTSVRDFAPHPATLLFAGDKIGAFTEEGLTVLSPKDLAPIRTIQGKWPYNATTISPDLSLIAGKSGTDVYLYSGADLTELGHFFADPAGVADIEFTPDGRFLLAAGSSGAVRLYNLKNGHLVSLLSSSDDWIAYTPDGYFDASRGAGPLLAMVEEGRAFSIDQFSLRNNRPDILMERLGLGAKAMVDHYKAAHARRLERAGFKEAELSSDLHVPTSRIVASQQQDKFVAIEAVLSDERAPLARYNVWVNDVPVFGSKGRPVSGNYAIIKERVELTSGTNKVEIGVTNSKGVESFRDQRDFSYAGDAKRTLHFIGFGVSKYQVKAMNLDYAAKDARDLAAQFTALGASFDAVRVHTFVDEQVTRKTITEARGLLADATVDDTLVLFIAGHGAHAADERGTYYYLTHEADVSDLASTAASFEDVEGLLDGIAPRRKLFLLDTCESGELLPSESAYYASASKDAGLSHRGLRKQQRPAAGADKTRSFLHDRDRYVHNDLVRRSGAIVMSSSRGGELSYESSKIEQGLFTHALLQAFADSTSDSSGDGQLSVRELRAYVEAKVRAASGGLQNPTIDRDNIFQTIVFGPPQPSKK